VNVAVPQSYAQATEFSPLRDDPYRKLGGSDVWESGMIFIHVQNDVSASKIAIKLMNLSFLLISQIS